MIIQMEEQFFRSIDVDRAYRKAGIATEMMRVVADTYGKDIGKPSFTAVGGKNTLKKIE